MAPKRRPRPATTETRSPREVRPRVGAALEARDTPSLSTGPPEPSTRLPQPVSGSHMILRSRRQVQASARESNTTVPVPQANTQNAHEANDQSPRKHPFDIWMENATLSSFKINDALLYSEDMLNIPFRDHLSSSGVLEHDRLLQSLRDFLATFPIEHQLHKQPYTRIPIDQPNLRQGSFILPLHEGAGLCLPGSEHWSPFLSLLKDLGICFSICKAMSKILCEEEVQNAKFLLQALTREGGKEMLPGVNENNCFFVARVGINVDSPPSYMLNECAFPFVVVVTLGTFSEGGELKAVSGDNEGGDVSAKVLRMGPGDVMVFGAGLGFELAPFNGGDRYQLELFLAG